MRTAVEGILGRELNRNNDCGVLDYLNSYINNA